MAVQLLFCGMLLSGFVQYTYIEHLYVKILLYIVLECSSRIELRVKVNTDLSMRKG